MKLNEAQQKWMMDKLNSLWVNKKCDVCGIADWGVSDTLMEIDEYFGKKLVLTGSKSPCIVASCKVCGQVKLFNAIFFGLVDQETGKLIDQQTGQVAGG